MQPKNATDKQHKNSVQKKEHTPAHLFAQVTLSSQVTGTQKTQRESFSPPFTELRPSFQDHSIMAMEQWKVRWSCSFVKLFWFSFCRKPIRRSADNVTALIVPKKDWKKEMIRKIWHQRNIASLKSVFFSLPCVKGKKSWQVGRACTKGNGSS